MSVRACALHEMSDAPKLAEAQTSAQSLHDYWAAWWIFFISYSLLSIEIEKEEPMEGPNQLQGDIDHGVDGSCHAYRHRAIPISSRGSNHLLLLRAVTLLSKGERNFSFDGNWVIGTFLFSFDHTLIMPTENKASEKGRRKYGMG